VVGAGAGWLALAALTLDVFPANTWSAAIFALRDAGRQILIWGLPESITLGIPGNLTLIRDERASLALAGQGEYLADTDVGVVGPTATPQRRTRFCAPKTPAWVPQPNS